MRPNLNPLPLIFPHHAPSKKHLIHHINPILLIQKRPLHFNDPILHLTYHLPFSIYYAPTTTLSRRSAPADPDLLRFSSTQPDLTGICACRVAGIEKEGRNCEPGTGAGKWDGSRFPVPILSHSSALFFSPAAPQVRSHARSSEVVRGRPYSPLRLQNRAQHILII